MAPPSTREKRAPAGQCAVQVSVQARRRRGGRLLVTTGAGVVDFPQGRRVDDGAGRGLFRPLRLGSRTGSTHTRVVFGAFRLREWPAPRDEKRSDQPVGVEARYGALLNQPFLVGGTNSDPSLDQGREGGIEAV